jgi:hypothetical protein
VRVSCQHVRMLTNSLNICMTCDCDGGWRRQRRQRVASKSVQLSRNETKKQHALA